MLLVWIDGRQLNRSCGSVSPYPFCRGSVQNVLQQYQLQVPVIPLLPCCAGIPVRAGVLWTGSPALLVELITTPVSFKEKKKKKSKLKIKR